MTKRLCAVQQLVLAVGLAGGVAPALFAQTGRMPAYVVPSYEDFRITTRMSHGDGPTHTTLTTLYLRGARERRESAVEQTGESATPLLASILQCDQRRAIHLNLSDQLFSEVTFVEWSKPLAGATTVPEAQGPVVTTIEDAVDTGERRRLGRHVARRVKTTAVVSPATGANTPASRRETDGWKHRPARPRLCRLGDEDVDEALGRRSEWSERPPSIPDQGHRTARLRD